MSSISDTIIYGSLAELETQLRQNPPLNVIDEYGFTPLIQTAIMNDADKGELLLDQGADIHQRDLTGGSALHWTAENNNVPFSRLLLSYQADPNAYNLSGQPVLVKPIMRRQKSLRHLLTQAGASIEFANDYINLKLLGHRFELTGYADIADPRERFVEVDFEGFILEFTIGVILNSLQDYRENFSARHLRRFFDLVGQLIATFSVAAQLIRFQQYQINLSDYTSILNTYLDHDILIIPVAYEGHAISFVRYKNLLAKCDRSHNDLFVDNVVIFQISRPQVLSKELIKNLMYKRQTKRFIDIELPHLLGLKPVKKLMISAQISGNCSWANIESCVPVIWYLLSDEKNKEDEREALSFYYQWLEWDKTRALHVCLQSFATASPVRRASIAAVLAAILFQRCSAQVQTDIERAQKIVPILRTAGYEYILKSYIEIYCHRNPGPAGENLQKLLRLSEYSYF
jgi:Ankyrin repeats (3 copies)